MKANDLFNSKFEAVVDEVSEAYWWVKTCRAAWREARRNPMRLGSGEQQWRDLQEARRLWKEACKRRDRTHA